MDKRVAAVVSATPEPQSTHVESLLQPLTTESTTDSFIEEEMDVDVQVSRNNMVENAEGTENIPDETTFGTLTQALPEHDNDTSEACEEEQHTEIEPWNSPAPAAPGTVSFSEFANSL